VYLYPTFEGGKLFPFLDQDGLGNKPRSRVVWIGATHHAIREREMADHDENQLLGGAHMNRRGLLKCMTWAGTGVLWTLSGGVPRSLGLLGEAAAEPQASGFTFLQISDSHVGFDKPANPNALATFQEAIAKVNAMPTPPAFIIHTGDITHLSKDKEFDDADQAMKALKQKVYVIPGEHDVADADNGKAYLARYGKDTKGQGWYSFDVAGVHFIALINVFNFEPGFKSAGLAKLGDEQLEWMEKDVAGRSASTPIVVLAHLPLWTIYPEWGWGTEDAGRALGYLKRFGSVTVLNGHIHQIVQKVEGNVSFHTARSTAFPIPVAGTGPAPGPMKVPAEQLHSVLGIRTVNYVRGKSPLAVIDTPLGA
jgi:Icc protein